MTWLDGSWDRVRLDGRVMPGRVASLTITPERDIQSSKVEGEDGITVKDQGYSGAAVELVIEVWRAADVPTLEQELARIHPRQTGGTATPHVIEHPIAAIANVRNVYIRSIALPMPEAGRWRVTISMSEWFSAEEKKPTKQAGGGGSAKPQSDAEDSLNPDGPVRFGEGEEDVEDELPAFKPGDSGGDFGSSEVPKPDPANKGAQFT